MKTSSTSPPQRGRTGSHRRGRGVSLERARGRPAQRGRGHSLSLQRSEDSSPLSDRGSTLHRGRDNSLQRGRGRPLQRGRGRPPLQRGRGRPPLQRGRGRPSFQRGRGRPLKRGRGRPALTQSSTEDSSQNAGVSSMASLERRAGPSPRAQTRDSGRRNSPDSEVQNSSVERKRRTATSPATSDTSITQAAKRRRISTETVSSTDDRKSTPHSRTPSREQNNVSGTRNTRASDPSKDQKSSLAETQTNKGKALVKPQRILNKYKSRLQGSPTKRFGATKFGKRQGHEGKKSFTSEMKRLSTTEGFWSSKRSSRSSSPATHSEHGEQTNMMGVSSTRGSKTSTPDVSPSSTKRKSLTKSVSKKPEEKEGTTTKANIPMTELRRLQTTDGFWSPIFNPLVPRSSSRDVSPSSVSSLERGSRQGARSLSRGSDNKSQSQKTEDSQDLSKTFEEKVSLKVKGKKTTAVEDSADKQQVNLAGQSKVNKVKHQPSLAQQSSEDHTLPEEAADTSLEPKPKRKHFYFGAKKRKGKKGPRFGSSVMNRVKKYGWSSGRKYGRADNRGKKRKVAPKRNKRFLDNLKEKKRKLLEDAAGTGDSKAGGSATSSRAQKNEKRRSGVLEGSTDDSSEMHVVDTLRTNKQRKPKGTSEEKASGQSSLTANQQDPQLESSTSTESAAPKRKRGRPPLRAGLAGKSPVKLIKAGTRGVKRKFSDIVSPKKMKTGNTRGMKRRFSELSSPISDRQAADFNEESIVPITDKTSEGSSNSAHKTISSPEFAIGDLLVSPELKRLNTTSGFWAPIPDIGIVLGTAQPRRLRDTDKELLSSTGEHDQGKETSGRKAKLTKSALKPQSSLLEHRKKKLHSLQNSRKKGKHLFAKIKRGRPRLTKIEDPSPVPSDTSLESKPKKKKFVFGSKKRKGKKGPRWMQDDLCEDLQEKDAHKKPAEPADSDERKTGVERLGSEKKEAVDKNMEDGLSFPDTPTPEGIPVKKTWKRGRKKKTMHPVGRQREIAISSIKTRGKEKAEDALSKSLEVLEILEPGKDALEVPVAAIEDLAEKLEKTCAKSSQDETNSVGGESDLERELAVNLTRLNVREVKISAEKENKQMVGMAQLSGQSERGIDDKDELGNDMLSEKVCTHEKDNLFERLEDEFAYQSEIAPSEPPTQSDSADIASVLLPQETGSKKAGNVGDGLVPELKDSIISEDVVKKRELGPSREGEAVKEETSLTCEQVQEEENTGKLKVLNIPETKSESKLEMDISQKTINSLSEVSLVEKCNGITVTSQSAILATSSMPEAIQKTQDIHVVVDNTPVETPQLTNKSSETTDTISSVATSRDETGDSLSQGQLPVATESVSKEIVEESHCHLSLSSPAVSTQEIALTDNNCTASETVPNIVVPPKSQAGAVLNEDRALSDTWPADELSALQGNERAREVSLTADTSRTPNTSVNVNETVERKDDALQSQEPMLFTADLVDEMKENLTDVDQSEGGGNEAMRIDEDSSSNTVSNVGSIDPPSVIQEKDVVVAAREVSGSPGTAEERVTAPIQPSVPSERKQNENNSPALEIPCSMLDAVPSSSSSVSTVACGTSELQVDNLAVVREITSTDIFISEVTGGSSVPDAAVSTPSLSSTGCPPHESQETETTMSTEETHAKSVTKVSPSELLTASSDEVHKETVSASSTAMSDIALPDSSHQHFADVTHFITPRVKRKPHRKKRKPTLRFFVRKKRGQSLSSSNQLKDSIQTEDQIVSLAARDCAGTSAEIGSVENLRGKFQEEMSRTAVEGMRQGQGEENLLSEKPLRRVRRRRKNAWKRGVVRKAANLYRKIERQMKVVAPQPFGDYTAASHLSENGEGTSQLIDEGRNVRQPSAEEYAPSHLAPGESTTPLTSGAVTDGESVTANGSETANNSKEMAASAAAEARKIKKFAMLKRLQTNANLATAVLNESSLQRRYLREVTSKVPPQRRKWVRRKQIASDPNLRDSSDLMKASVRDKIGELRIDIPGESTGQKRKRGRPRKRSDESLPKLTPSSDMLPLSSVDSSWNTAPPRLSPQIITTSTSSNSFFDPSETRTTQETDFVSESVDETDFHLYLSGISDEEPSPTKDTVFQSSAGASVYLPIILEDKDMNSNIQGAPKETLADSQTARPSSSQQSGTSVILTGKGKELRRPGRKKIKGRRGRPPGIPMTDEERRKKMQKAYSPPIAYEDYDVFKSPRTARKSMHGPNTNSASVSGAPATKFSLRKKSTRSPLEMLEMKRREEEAKYDMEQEKRQARLIHLREKRFARESSDGFPYDGEGGEADSSEEGLRLCSVVLSDFVKKLQLDSVESRSAGDTDKESERLEDSGRVSPDYSAVDEQDEDWCADLEDYSDNDEEWDAKRQGDQRPHIPRLKLKRVMKKGRPSQIKRKKFVPILPRPVQHEPIRLVIKTEPGDTSGLKSTSVVDLSKVERKGFEGSFVDFLKKKKNEEVTGPKSLVSQKMYVSRPVVPGTNSAQNVAKEANAGVEILALPTSKVRDMPSTVNNKSSISVPQAQANPEFSKDSAMTDNSNMSIMILPPPPALALTVTKSAASPASKEGGEKPAEATRRFFSVDEEEEDMLILDLDDGSHDQASDDSCRDPLAASGTLASTDGGTAAGLTTITNVEDALNTASGVDVRKGNIADEEKESSSVDVRNRTQRTHSNDEMGLMLESYNNEKEPATMTETQTVRNGSENETPTTDIVSANDSTTTDSHKSPSNITSAEILVEPSEPSKVDSASDKHVFSYVESSVVPTTASEDSLIVPQQHPPGAVISSEEDQQVTESSGKEQVCEHGDAPSITDKTVEDSCQALGQAGSLSMEDQDDASAISTKNTAHQQSTLASGAQLASEDTMSTNNFVSGGSDLGAITAKEVGSQEISSDLRPSERAVSQETELNSSSSQIISGGVVSQKSSEENADASPAGTTVVPDSGVETTSDNIVDVVSEAAHDNNTGSSPRSPAKAPVTVKRSQVFSENSKSPKHLPYLSSGPEGWKVKVIPQSDKQASGKYTCKRCNFTTSAKLTIESHVYSHIPGVQFRCAYCESEFSSMTATSNHLKNIHSVREAKLRISRHVDEKNFYDKELAVFSEENVQPPPAPAISTSAGGQSPPVIISVVVSGTVGSSRASRSGAPPRRFVCTHCGFSTNVKEDAEHHVSDLHSADPLFACVLCNESICCSETEIKEHCATVHPSRSRPYRKLPDYYDAEQLSTTGKGMSQDDRENIFDRMSSIFQDDPTGNGDAIDHRQRAKDYLYLQDYYKAKMRVEADSTTNHDNMEEQLPAQALVSEEDSDAGMDQLNNMAESEVLDQTGAESHEMTEKDALMSKQVEIATDDADTTSSSEKPGGETLTITPPDVATTSAELTTRPEQRTLSAIQQAEEEDNPSDTTKILPATVAPHQGDSTETAMPSSQEEAEQPERETESPAGKAKAFTGEAGTPAREIEELVREDLAPAGEAETPAGEVVGETDEAAVGEINEAAVGEIDETEEEAGDEGMGLKIVQVVSLSEQSELLDEESIAAEEPVPEIEDESATQDKTDSATVAVISGDSGSPEAGVSHTTTSTTAAVPQQEAQSPRTIPSPDRVGQEKEVERATTQDSETAVSSAASETTSSNVTTSSTPTPTSASAPNALSSSSLPLSYKCNACKVHTPYLLMMVKHLKAKHPNMRCFACPYCKATHSFVSQKQLRHHVKQAHPDKIGRNEIALSEEAKKFVEAMVLPNSPECIRVGNRVVLEEDIHTCTHCQLKMTSLANVYEHLNGMHSDLFEFVCPVCQSFKSKMLNVISDHCMQVHKSSLDTDKVHVSVPKNLFTALTCISKNGKYIEKSLDVGTDGSTPGAAKTSSTPTPTTSTSSQPQAKVSTSQSQQVTVQKPVPSSASVVGQTNSPQQQSPASSVAASVVSTPPVAPQAQTLVSVPQAIPQFLSPTPLIAIPLVSAAVGSIQNVAPTRPIIAFSSALFDTSSLTAPPQLVSGRSQAVPVIQNAAASSFLSPLPQPQPAHIHNQTGQLTRLPATPQQTVTNTQGKSPVSTKTNLPVLNIPTVKPRASQSTVRTSQSPRVPDHSISPRASPSQTPSTLHPTPASPASSSPLVDNLPEDEPNPDAFKIFNLRPSGPHITSAVPVPPPVSPGVPTVFPPVSAPITSGYIQGPMAGFPVGMVIPPNLFPQALSFSQHQATGPVMPQKGSSSTISSASSRHGRIPAHPSSAEALRGDRQPQQPSAASAIRGSISPQTAAATTMFLKEQQQRELFLLKQQKLTNQQLEAQRQHQLLKQKQLQQQAHQHQRAQLQKKQAQLQQQQAQLSHPQIPRAHSSHMQQQSLAGPAFQQFSAPSQSPHLDQRQSFLEHSDIPRPSSLSSSSSSSSLSSLSANTAQSSNTTRPAKGVHKRSSCLYQCPYCPTVLRALEVASHIQQQHPGSPVTFKKIV